MRGRTNASNGGIFLNATTDDFEVATGNSIVAGDFVEYKYDTEVKPLNSTFSGVSYLIDATTHTYIALIGTYPTLFTYINGEISVVYSYSTSATHLVQFDTTHYAILNSSTYKFELLFCTTSAISKITETSTTYSNVGECARVNATKIAFRNGNTYLKTVNTDSEYTTLSVVDGVNTQNFKLVGASSDKIVIMQTTSSASSYSNTFIVYNADTFTNLGSFTISTDYMSLNVLPEIVIDDRYFVLRHTERIGSSPYKYYMRLYVIDSVNLRSVTSLQFTDVNNNALNVRVSTINTQNEFVVEIISSNNSYLYWVKYDTELSSLSKSEYTQFNKIGYLYAFSAKKFALMINNEGYANLDTTSGKVIAGTPTNRVKEWAGSGDPLGVAKQSGNAGDTIAVYIPQVNS